LSPVNTNKNEQITMRRGGTESGGGHWSSVRRTVDARPYRGKREVKAERKREMERNKEVIPYSGYRKPQRQNCTLKTE